MAETLKEKTAKGLFWGGLNNGVQQLLNLLFGIFLARLLSQSDYGIIGMIAIFSSLATTLQGGGFASAINRKKDVCHDDYNAVFWTSVSISAAIYIILYVCSPLIADFYGMPELIPLSRYTFLGFLIASVGIAPAAYMFRNMMVREMAILQISSIFIAGVVGTIMAYSGFSYWGLATQNNICILVGAVMYYYFTGWRPSLKIRLSPIRGMLAFSSKLIITNIFNIINANIFSVILGKKYLPRDVGNYTQANKWNNMGSSFISGMLSNVAQPVFARVNDDKERQKRVFRKLLRFTAFISFPAMFGLALVAKEFIVILLTEKWLESALMMQMLCIAGAFAPLSSLFSNLIITRGHSTTYMWCSIALCLIQLLAVILSAGYGIERMIQCYVIINIVWLFVWHYYTHQEICLRLSELIKDVSPYFLLTLLIVAAAAQLTVNIANIYLSLVLKVVFVTVSYFISLWLLGSTIFQDLITAIKNREIV